jgi:uncharacterized protein
MASVWNVVSGRLVSLCVLLLACLIGSLAVAGPFEDGAAANARGDYATAVKLWTPLAERGDPDAQLALGDMHSQGRGVLQDYAEALKWYRLAAQQGSIMAEVALAAAERQLERLQQLKTHTPPP